VQIRQNRIFSVLPRTNVIKQVHVTRLFPPNVMFVEKLDIYGAEQRQNYAIHGAHKMDHYYRVHFLWLSVINSSNVHVQIKHKYATFSWNRKTFVRWGISMKMVDKVSVVLRIWNMINKERRRSMNATPRDPATRTGDKELKRPSNKKRTGRKA
jgi:hypothetical protein